MTSCKFDINANVTQQVLYAPFGEVISESNAHVKRAKENLRLLKIFLIRKYLRMR
jgi:hypothetical protein